MSGDYVARLRAFLDAREATGEAKRGTISVAHADGSRTGEGPGMYRRPLTDADLRAALAELEQLRVERKELGEAENQWRIVSQNGPIHSFTERDLADRANWLPGVYLEQRTVYGTPWVESASQQPEDGETPAAPPRSPNSSSTTNET